MLDFSNLRNMSLGRDGYTIFGEPTFLKNLGDNPFNLSNPFTTGSFTPTVGSFTPPKPSVTTVNTQQGAGAGNGNNLGNIGTGLLNAGKSLVDSIKGGGFGYDLASKGLSLVNGFIGQDVENSDGFNLANSALGAIGSMVGTVNPVAGLAFLGVLTGLNLINSIGGKRADTFTIDLGLQADMGSSYADSYADMSEAASKSGKKYGLLSGSARRRANRLIREAQRLQNIIAMIDKENEDFQAMGSPLLNGLNYTNTLNGGIDFRYMRAAKLGVKLDLLHRVKRLNTKEIINLETKLIEEFKPIIEVGKFKNGGAISEEFKPIITKAPKLQKGGKTDVQSKPRTIEELIQYAKELNPRFILRMTEPIKYLDLGNGEKGTHLMSWSTDDKGNAIVYSLILENEEGNLVDYGDDAINRALETKNYLIMTPEEAKLFTESSEDSEGNLFGYKKGWPDFFRERYDFSQDGDYFNSEDPEIVEAYKHFKLTLPINQRLTPESKYRSYLYWKSWGQPKDFAEAKTLRDGENSMYDFDESDNSYHGTSVAWLDGIGYFTKPIDHNTIKFELDYYNDGTITEEGGKLRKPNEEELKAWLKFKDSYDLVKEGNFYKYVPKKFERGGSIKEESKDLVELKETNLKNVIPEGALHKNKHHIEHTEGLTLKGIPVIDNDGELQAEIELDEIIFTLEVTKKLEELHKLYKEGDKTQLDLAAIEAGKLLVQEILYNTDDRTGLIDKCLKGGKLK